jgi:hypothetical protein
VALDVGRGCRMTGVRLSPSLLENVSFSKGASALRAACQMAVGDSPYRMTSAAGSSPSLVGVSRCWSARYLVQPSTLGW